MATDSDADRLNAVVWNGETYVLLTGNQLGALLLHYLLQMKKFPTNGTMIKTIVTPEIRTAIANKFGVTTVNTLTCFIFNAEKMTEWERIGEYTFLFGYEESSGYLGGGFVSEKDAVRIALLTAEMADYYKEQGKTLLNVLG